MRVRAGKLSSKEKILQKQIYPAKYSGSIPDFHLMLQPMLGI